MIGILCAFGIACIFLGYNIAGSSEDRSFHIGVGSAISLTLGIFVIAAGIDYSRGKVPGEAELYTDRLDTGVIYRVRSGVDLNGQHILLLQKDGVNQFYAIRVGGPAPPSRFTLIDGRPVAVK